MVVRQLSVLAWIFNLVAVSSFSFTWRGAIGRPPIRLDVSTSTEDSNQVDAEDLFNGSRFYEFTLVDHKPMGCTVEESLAPGRRPDGTKDEALKHVFLSAVTAGGNAQLAGLQMGDVVVGVTGVFGNVEPVVGAGIEKVKGLVVSCPDDVPLKVKVARGTSVMEDHEKILVELCSDPTLDGKKTEECIATFLEEGYNYNVDATPNSQKEEYDIEENDLLDNMFNLWAEETESTMPNEKQAPKPTERRVEEAAKPKPWSSRSSPSGTFVRDPRTGKMNNID